jgi:YHS domain-containing protein
MDVSIRVFEDKDKVEYLNVANSMFENLNESVLTFDKKGGYDWYKFVAEFDKKIIGFSGYYFASKERMESLKKNNETYFGFEHDYYIFN